MPEDLKEGFINSFDPVDGDDEDENDFYVREEDDNDVDFERNAFDI